MTTLNDNNIVKQLRDRGEKDARLLLIIIAILTVIVLTLIIIGVIVVLVMSKEVRLEEPIGVFTGIVIGILIILLLNIIIENLMAANIRINGIRVSENQIPELNAVVNQCSMKLGVAPPEVYVMQDSIWNAFAMKVGKKKMIVLLSGSIDSLLLKGDMAQLSWVVAHEIGHHVCGHLSSWNRFLEILCSFSWPWVVLWHRRRGELSCDRIAMYCVGSADASFKALANMTAGAQMANIINKDKAIEQWHKHKGDFFSIYVTLYSTHPANLCRFAVLKEMQEEFNIPD
jgi:Zn-dependent protease with chaperone function